MSLLTRAYSFFGLEFDFDNVAFYIGDKGIYWYGILIAAAFITALLYCYFRADKFGVNKDKMIDVVIAGIVGGVIFARLYYVLFDFLDGGAYNSFLDVIAIWDGGIAIYGGVIGGLLFGGIMCKIRKIHVLDMFDLAMPGFLIGQCIGRWGNFVNQEVYGKATGSDWFGIGVDTGYGYVGELVHPLFLYESLWCLAGFVITHFISKNRKFRGQIFSFYLIWYSFGRFWFEGMRQNVYILKIGPFAISQLVAVACIIAGIVMCFILRKRTSLVKEEDYTSIYGDLTDNEDALDSDNNDNESESEEESDCGENN